MLADLVPDPVVVPGRELAEFVGERGTAAERRQPEEVRDPAWHLAAPRRPHALGYDGAELVLGQHGEAGLAVQRRDRIIEPLRLLLAAPYLLFFLSPPPALAVPLGFLAAAGYAASLPLQDRLIRHTDEAIQGQVLGLHMNGMMTWQAIAALIAGAVASFLPPATAMGTMAAASTTVTLLLVPCLRRSAPAARTTIPRWAAPR